MLQRSECIKGGNNPLAAELMALLETWSFANLLIVTGAYLDMEFPESARRNFHCGAASPSLSSPSPSPPHSLLSTFPLLIRSVLDPLVTLDLVGDPTSAAESARTIRGAKLATCLVKTCSGAESGTSGTSIHVLGRFCGRGDNTNDALELTAQLCYGLGITSDMSGRGLSQPASWAMNVRGDAEIESSMFY